MAIAVIAGAMQVGYNLAVTGNVLGERASVTTERLLEDTNKERTKYHQDSLKINGQLSRAAALKAQDMIEKQYWAHNAPDGGTPWRWFHEVGYQYSLAGENLAKDFQSADAVVAAWMASPQHRANVLGSYTEVGFAATSGKLDGKDTTIIVALYGSPVSAVPVVQTSSAAPLGFMSRLGVAVQTLSPATLGALVLVGPALFVALLAHMYRGRLPKSLRDSWYRHHGLVKAGGLLGVAVIILTLQTGGQI